MIYKTCEFCGTLPNASDPTVCRSRDQASACTWAAGRLKPDGMSEADRLLNRIRIKAPGCGDVVLDLDRIVARALGEKRRERA